MRKQFLRISKTLALPLKAVVGTHAIVGRKREGKTFKAKVMAEEMLKAKQQIIVIDPTDAWWGLRSSADGATAGYPISIFGGRHGQAPLDPNHGAEYARAVIEEGFSAIFVLKGLSNAAEQRFCATFLETMYTDNKQEPLHIFMDEADMYAPQMPQGEEMRTLGATKKIVRRGGLDGVGITLITQRTADIAKSVLTQCDTLIAVALSHPADLRPVEDWIKVQVKSLELAGELMESLPDLPKGDAWVWSPHHQIRKRVRFRELETFDSSRTPEPGEKRREPKVMSEVDISKLGEKIAALAEQARESDPKHMKAKLVELRAELAAKQRGYDDLDEMVPGPEDIWSKVAALVKRADKPAAAGKTTIKTVDRPVLKDGQLARIEAMLAAGDKLITRYDDVAANAHDAIDRVRDKVAALHGELGESLEAIRTAVKETTAAPLGYLPVGETPSPERKMVGTGGRIVSGSVHANGSSRPLTPPEIDKMNRRMTSGENGVTAIDFTPPVESSDKRTGRQLVLAAIIQHPGIERVKLSAYCVLKKTTRNLYVQELLREGLVTEDDGLRVTPAGRAAMPSVAPLPTGRALRDKWLAELPTGEGQIFRVLVNAYPKRMTRDQILPDVFKKTTRNLYIQKLARRDIIDEDRSGLTASPTLFEVS